MGTVGQAPAGRDQLRSVSLVAAGCSSDDGSTEPSSSPVPTESAAPDETEAPGPTDNPTATDAPATSDVGASGDFTARVPTLGAPTGEPMVVGLINSEGVPGLDFPDIRIDIEATFAKQEIAGSGVELVLLGLDLFPGYPTFDASELPVIGLLPILPGDYTANALFVTGGNATLASGMSAVAKERFDAESIGIISADNPGANGTEVALKASLDEVGIPYVSIKGGNEETDAGFQGLMAQANANEPDLLVSLYDGVGCIAIMRGRTTLGITTPMLAASSCAASQVIEQVGDEALGWIFLGAPTNDERPATQIICEIMAPSLGVPVDEVNPAGLGLGGIVVRLLRFDLHVALEERSCGRVRQGARLSIHLHIRIPRHRVHRGRVTATSRRHRNGVCVRLPPVRKRRST